MIQLIYDRQLTFGPEQILSAVYRQKTDPIFCGQPEGELVVELCTEQPLAPQREELLELYWQGQLLVSHHITQCQRLGKRRYQLRAKPRLQYLQTKFYGAMYRQKMLSQILRELFPEESPVLDPMALDQEISGYVPPGTRAQALTQLAFRLGFLQTLAPDGNILLKNPEGNDMHVLAANQVQQLQQRFLPFYTRYELASHQYTRGTLTKKLVDEREYQPGIVTLTFSQPHSSFAVDENEGARIREEGSNHVVVEQSGLVSLFGVPYIHETQFHTLPGVQSQDPRFSQVLTVRDMTLITPEVAPEGVGRLRDYGQLRQKLWLAYYPRQGSLPRVGDQITLQGEMVGLITEEKITFFQGRLQVELTAICKEVQ